MLILPLVAMVAFAVDYGYLLKIRTDLQRAADSAALASVQELVPRADGSQNLDAARYRIREYLARNIDPAFVILDSDIEIGRYDPATIYSQVTLLPTGIFDTVRITVRRDEQANLPVSLFFARVLGSRSSGVTASATAVLQRASAIPPGAMILPFAVPVSEWESKDHGEIWSIYADGKLTDSDGAEVPGNWGTVDIGPTKNSTNLLRDQINSGLHQADLDALQADGRISSNDEIGAKQQFWANGNPGMSIGMKDAIRAAQGSKRVVPLFDALGDTLAGGNVEFHVVGWGVVRVVESKWTGEHKSYVHVEKTYTYDGALRAQPDLGNTTNVIDGAFTSPALVE